MYVRPGVCAERLTGVNSCGQTARIKLHVSNHAHQSACFKTARADRLFLCETRFEAVFRAEKSICEPRGAENDALENFLRASAKKIGGANFFAALRGGLVAMFPPRNRRETPLSFAGYFFFTKLQNYKIAESDFLIELGYNKVSSKNAAKQFCAFAFFASAERGFWNFSPRNLRLPKFKNAVVFSDSILNPRNCKVAKIAGLNAPT